ncbi:MAG: hypothetical protein ACI31R_02240 [Bacilli bacterium]
MLPNVPAKIFSLSAVIVGYILIDDMTAKEQNALGNWLMLVAQVLSTNAFYRQVREERGLEKEGSTESESKNYTSKASTTNQNNNHRNQSETEETLVMLEKMIRALKKEIEQVKKEL